MTRRTVVWGVAGIIFAVGNLAGAVMAAAQGELSHAGLHAGLMLLGALFALRMWRTRQPAPTPMLMLSAIADRMTQLELSLEGLAMGVERVGEGQRFITSFFSERGIATAPPERDLALTGIEAQTQA